MSEVCDLAVIGGGPAGLAAAAVAAAEGLSVTLLDEQSGPGGQIYRGIETRLMKPGAPDGDMLRGGALARAFRESGARAVFGASVWSVESSGQIGFSVDGRAQLITAQRIVVATGATERPVPLPGWTLPGVLTVGAAQILLKTAGIVPQGRVWLVGQGPLLRLYATQALAAGARFAGILDTTPPGRRQQVLTKLPMGAAAWRDLSKGLAWSTRIAAARIPWLAGASDIAIEPKADGAVGAIAFTVRGQRRREQADIVLLHEGVVPNVQITRALDAAHVWDGAQRCFRPVLDEWGQSSLERVFVAGDGGGIAGAAAAAASGRLAGIAVAYSLSAIDRNRRNALAAPLRRELRRQKAIRPFLDALFAPRPEILAPADDTIVCRCEAVPARVLREAVGLGCVGPNQLKAFTRCGMGPCQGRYCGLTTTEVIAAARGVSPEDVGYYRLRPPIKPLTLGELAAMHEPKP
jgi:NADPH-dependent 2,4-dienoyl-CoA reductase/sulfur reductase-like enzyme